MLYALLFLLRKYQIEIRGAIAIAGGVVGGVTAIAPVFEDEPLGLGDALDGTEGLGSVPLVRESEDEVAKSNTCLYKIPIRPDTWLQHSSVRVPSYNSAAPFKAFSV